jgi:hypothetical protein
MSKVVKEDATEVGETLARRGSDHPHSFKPTAGYRTCLHCGLPKGHEIHEVAKFGDTCDVSG